MPFVAQVRPGDREGVAKHAAPEALTAMLKRARAAHAAAGEELDWLQTQLARRCAEVATRQWPPDLAANGDKVSPAIASLCEIVAEMIAAVSDDPSFVTLTRNILREHAHSLGFNFQGTLPDA